MCGASIRAGLPKNGFSPAENRLRTVPWQLSAWNATNKEVVKIEKHQVKLRHFGAKMS